jgi:cell division protein FtsB
VRKQSLLDLGFIKHMARPNNVQARPKWVQKAWLGFFLFWLLALTGMFHQFAGSPGVVQYRDLNQLLHQTKQESIDLEFEMDRMRGVIQQLESNPVAQEREVRKVLGYVGDDEVVFDF